MIKRFISSPPAGQNAETFRQFQTLQTVLKELTDEVERLKAAMEALRNDVGG